MVSSAPCWYNIPTLLNHSYFQQNTRALTITALTFLKRISPLFAWSRSADHPDLSQSWTFLTYKCQTQLVLDVSSDVPAQRSTQLGQIVLGVVVRHFPESVLFKGQGSILCRELNYLWLLDMFQWLKFVDDITDQRLCLCVLSLRRSKDDHSRVISLSSTPAGSNSEVKTRAKRIKLNFFILL